MNDEARKHIDNAVSSLDEAKQYLVKALNNAENGSIRERIDKELSNVDSCLRKCESIASGFSQQ